MLLNLYIWDFKMGPLRFIKASLFLAVFFAVSATVDCVLTRKSAHSSSIRQFFDSRQQYDLLAFGSSYVYASVSPPCLYRDFGVRAFVLASPSQPINETYFFVKQALEHHVPEIVLVGVDMVVRSGAEYVHSSEGVHEATDGFPLGMTKLALIRNLNSPASLDEFLVPLLKYHSRWKELTMFDYVSGGGRKHFNGHVPYRESGFKNDVESYDIRTTRRAKIFERNIEWLDGIRELCKSKGVKLCLLSTPRRDGVAGGRLAALHDWTNEKGIDFIDLNLDFHVAGFSNDTDFHDFGHLNVLGAEKASHYIGKWLVSQRCACATERGRDPMCVWDNEVARYEKAKCELVKSSKP